MGPKRLQIAKDIFRKKSGARDRHRPAFRLNYKALVIKTQKQKKYRQMEQD